MFSEDRPDMMLEKDRQQEIARENSRRPFYEAKPQDEPMPEENWQEWFEAFQAKCLELEPGQSRGIFYYLHQCPPVESIEEFTEELSIKKGINWDIERRSRDDHQIEFILSRDPDEE